MRYGRRDSSNLSALISVSNPSLKPPLKSLFSFVMWEKTVTSSSPRSPTWLFRKNKHYFPRGMLTTNRERRICILAQRKHSLTALLHAVAPKKTKPPQTPETWLMWFAVEFTCTARGDGSRQRVCQRALVAMVRRTHVVNFYGLDRSCDKFNLILKIKESATLSRYSDKMFEQYDMI